MTHQQLTIFGESETVQSPLEVLMNRPKPDPDLPIVVSYGGGTNSTAMLIAMVYKGIKPDLILFADTGGELPETYEFIHRFSGWLVNQGFPGVTTIKRKRTVAKKTGIEYETLEEKMKAYSDLPSKVFGSSSCSISFKVDTINKYMKEWLKTKNCEKYRQLVGIHYNEKDRVLRAIQNKGVSAIEDNIAIKEFPLIEWRMSQQDCDNLIASAGFGKIPKSSCFFCPNRTPKEVLELKEKHPDLYQRAIEMENRAKPKLTKIKGLGRTWAWSEIDKLTELEKIGLEFRQAQRQCRCTD